MHSTVLVGDTLLPINPTVFMGLDLSIRSTGICVLDGDPAIPAAERVCTWQVNGNPHKGIARIAKLVNQIEGVHVWANSLGTALTVIEGYGTRGGENNVLVELGGVVRYELFRAESPFIVVPPTSLKKFVTGRGNADKVMVCEYIERRYGCSFLRAWPGKDHPKKPKDKPAAWGSSPAHFDNDSADAFALAHLGFALINGCLPNIPQLTHYESEVIAGIKLDPHGELLEENSLRKEGN